MLLNIETLEQLYAVCVYPEDTLLSYMVLLGDLVENLKERQKLLQQLNQAIINMTDNKVHIELIQLLNMCLQSQHGDLLIE